MKRLVCAGVLIVMGMTGGGCVFKRTLRPVSMELSTTEGKWRLDGIESATLDLEDWEIRILESKVAVDPKIPYLEQLVLEIANTSETFPLVLEPGEVRLSGLEAPVFLGPLDRVVLKPGESHIIDYSPWLRAKFLPYPFHLYVTVFRGVNFRQPQNVKLVLY